MLFLSLDQLTLPSIDPGSYDGIEIRVDLLLELDEKQLLNFINSCSKPVLLTLRSISQGGLSPLKGKEREKKLKQLLLLQPDFLDWEYDNTPFLFPSMKPLSPKTQCILSFHSHQMIEDVKQLYKEMQKHPAYAYKIATYAPSSTAALKLLLEAKKCRGLSLICMGETASFTRILAPIFEQPLAFTCLSNKTAQGQIPIDTLINVYRYRSLNRETTLYGLIGDPVEASLGDLYHNEAFAKKKQNSVYVKMKVTQEELPAFLPLVHAAGFKGLSVTMPLKEKVYTLTSSSCKEKAINTLKRSGHGFTSLNTDGKAALDAIETRKSVKGKRVVLLGAGGASQAIAWEAKKRGAELFILNRTLDKAISLCRELEAIAGSLADVPSDFFCIINTIPCMEALKDLTFPPSSLAFDIVYNPKETPFLKEAKRQGAEILYGEEMFLRQADLQQQFWSR